MPPSGSPTEIDPTTKITIPVVQTEMEAQLHWSEYLQGEWTTRESGDFVPAESQKLKAISVDPRRVFISVAKEAPENGEERGVFVNLSSPFNMAFYLAGRNSVPEKGTSMGVPAHPYTPAWGMDTVKATQYTGSGPFKVGFTKRITTIGAGWSSGGAETPSILQQGSSFSLLPCDNNLDALGVSEDAYLGASNPTAVKAALERSVGQIASLIKPVFYQDNAHTLFVEPSVTERTIEEWQDWVTRTPQPEPAWVDPGWWRELIVLPEIPKPWLDPRDPRLGFDIDPGALFNPVRGFDWLVNPGTVLELDGVLIGPAGQPGLEIITPEISPGLAAGGLAAAGQQVNVNPGSSLAEGLPNPRRTKRMPSLRLSPRLTKQLGHTLRFDDYSLPQKRDRRNSRPRRS